MPRRPRLDAPLGLISFITRGIERGDIFKDKTDYEDFLALGKSNLKGKTQLYLGLNS